MKKKFTYVCFINLFFSIYLFSHDNSIISKINVPLTIDFNIPIVTSMQLQGKIYYYNDEDYHNDTMQKITDKNKDIEILISYIGLAKDNKLEEFRKHCAEGKYKDGCSYVVNIINQSLKSMNYKIRYKIKNNERNMYIIEFFSEKEKYYMFMVMSLFDNEYKLLYPSTSEYCYFNSLVNCNKLNIPNKFLSDIKYNNKINIIKDEENSVLNYNEYIIKCQDIRESYQVLPANNDINKVIDFFIQALKMFEEMSTDEFAMTYFTEKSCELFIKNVKKMSEANFKIFKNLLVNGIKVYYVIDANPMYIIFFTTPERKLNWISHSTKNFNYIYIIKSNNKFLITRTKMKLDFDILMLESMDIDTHIINLMKD